MTRKIYTKEIVNEMFRRASIGQSSSQAFTEMQLEGVTNLQSFRVKASVLGISWGIGIRKTFVVVPMNHSTSLAIQKAAHRYSMTMEAFCGLLCKIIASDNMFDSIIDLDIPQRNEDCTC